MGWAAGMAAGTAMAKQALANRDAKEEKERDAAIAKGLSKLDADQALRVKYAAENDPSKISIANTAQSGGLGENTLAPQQNMSPVQSPGAAYTPLQMAEMRRGLYNANNDADGAMRYEDQATGLRAVEESNRRFDTTTANQQSQFDTTIANQQSQFDDTLAQTKAEHEVTEKRLTQEREDTDKYRSEMVANYTSAEGREVAEAYSNDLTKDAQRAVRGSAGSGTLLSDIARDVPEKYKDDPKLWHNEVRSTYLTESGMSAPDFNQTIKQIVTPLINTIRTARLPPSEGGYKPEEKLSVFTELLQSADPDPTDEVFPTIEKMKGAYVIVYGNEVLAQGAPDGELEDLAQTYLDQVQENPTAHALDRIDFLRVNTLKKAKAYETLESKREYISKIGKEFPQIFRDETLRDELLEVGGYDVGQDTTGTRWQNAMNNSLNLDGQDDPEIGIGSGYADVAGLVASADSSIAKRDATATAETAAQDAARSQADTLVADLSPQQLNEIVTNGNLDPILRRALLELQPQWGLRAQSGLQKEIPLRYSDR